MRQTHGPPLWHKHILPLVWVQCGMLKAAPEFVCLSRPPLSSFMGTSIPLVSTRCSHCLSQEYCSLQAYDCYAKFPS